MLSAAVDHVTAQVIVMGIPTVERAVIQKEDKTGNYTLLVEGTGLQVCATMTGSRGLCAWVCWWGGFRTMHLCWLSPVPKMCTVLNLCLWGPSLITPTRWSMGWASRQLAGPSWTVHDLLSAVAPKLTHYLSPLHSLSFLTHSITLASSLILTRYHSLTLLPPSFCLFRL
jgi:hypothetical protein